MSHRPGRPLTKGRYATRAELVEMVWHLRGNSWKKLEIARVADVSAQTVSNILRQPRPDEPEGENR